MIYFFAKCFNSELLLISRSRINSPLKIKSNSLSISMDVGAIRLSVSGCIYILDRSGVDLQHKDPFDSINTEGNPLQSLKILLKNFK